MRRRRRYDALHIKQVCPPAAPLHHLIATRSVDAYDFAGTGDKVERIAVAAVLSLQSSGA